jgi:hypothetical protein
MYSASAYYGGTVYWTSGGRPMSRYVGSRQNTSFCSSTYPTTSHGYFTISREESGDDMCLMMLEPR